MDLGNDAVENLKLATLSSETFVYCAITFTELFMEHCLGVNDKIIKQKTNGIRNEFIQEFTKFYNEAYLMEETI